MYFFTTTKMKYDINVFAYSYKDVFVEITENTEAFFIHNFMTILRFKI